MAAHLAVIEKPVHSLRPIELGMTGLERPRRRGDFRQELRGALLRPGFFQTAAKHRSTFVPLGTLPGFID